MSGALGGDVETVCTGELDDRDHVVDRVDDRNDGRYLVDREVPGLPRLVPAGIARQDDLSGHPSRAVC